MSHKFRPFLRRTAHLCDIFSCTEYPVVRLETMHCHEWVFRMNGYNVRSWQAKTAARPRFGVLLVTQFVSSTAGINCSIFFRPSYFKDCVAIAMCLIVTVFPLLTYIYWLLYCVVYFLYKITQLEEQDNIENVFKLQRTEFKSKIPSVAQSNVLLRYHDALLWCFLWSAIVVYPCDIHKVSRRLTGKKGQLKKEIPSQWLPVLALALCLVTKVLGLQIFG